MGNKGLTQIVQDSVVAPHGNVWYVDGTNGGATFSGRTPESAMTTLALARAASAAGDIIVIAPGTYTVDVSAAALAPKANQIWMAGTPGCGGAPNVIVIADADDGATTVAVDVNGVVFKDIEFRLVAGGTTALNVVAAAQTTAVRGLAFINCWFNLNSVDAASVFACQFNDPTNAITGLVMRNCRFIGGDATTATTNYIDVGVGGIPDALIEYCVFVLQSIDGDAVGINFNDPGAASKSYAHVIRDNDFIGSSDAGNDAVGVKFAAAMTEDEIVGMIRGNFFAHCSSSPVTIDRVNSGIINNYSGDDATGGTLVDPGT